MFRMNKVSGQPVNPDTLFPGSFFQFLLRVPPFPVGKQHMKPRILTADGKRILEVPQSSKKDIMLPLVDSPHAV